MLVSSQKMKSSSRLPASTSPSMLPVKALRIAKKSGARSGSLR
jgi:hypothetical protein